MLEFRFLIPFSTFIYLDYAAVFPYTGGEIVYVSNLAPTVELDELHTDFVLRRLTK